MQYLITYKLNSKASLGGHLACNVSTHSQNNWKLFAPTREMVYGVKGSYDDSWKETCRLLGIKVIQWEQFADEYVKLIRNRVIQEPGKFDVMISIAATRGVAIGCYCDSEKACDGRCHRILAASIIRNCAKAWHNVDLEIVESTNVGYRGIMWDKHPYVIPVR